MTDSTPDLQRPNLRRLVMFDAVMRGGSTGAAARGLGLSQPAVSDALSKLEAETGTQLLERGTGGSTCSYGRSVQTLKNSIQSDIDYLNQYGTVKQ